MEAQKYEVIQGSDVWTFATEAGAEDYASDLAGYHGRDADPVEVRPAGPDPSWREDGGFALYHDC